MTRKSPLFLAVFGAAFASAVFAEDLRVLPTSATEPGGRPLLADALRAESYAALAGRRAAFEKVKTADEVRQWQSDRRDFFLRQLGGLPERTPLNARVVGTLAGDRYRIEKVIYESQPGHHVTANLYLPVTPPPYPGVIVPNGHDFEGKVAEVHQRLGMLMARNGLATLIYDPIGQGERYQTFGRDGRPLTTQYETREGHLKMLDAIPQRPRFNPVEEHVLVGIGSILVGRNAATYRIFDGMRSIDYLISRPDIDPRRIGCTGNSGGGTLTAYLMALDDRILAAAPACWLTTRQRLLEIRFPGGPQDAEQNIYGQIAMGLDEPDFILMRAPKPTVLLAGARDVTFSIIGTWEAFREGKRFFMRLGHPERMDMVEADEPHGFTQPLRIGATRWMRRWLLDKDDAITEVDLPLRSANELLCNPDGQVMLLPGEQSVFDFNRAEAVRLARERVENWRGTPREARGIKVTVEDSVDPR